MLERHFEAILQGKLAFVASGLVRGGRDNRAGAETGDEKMESHATVTVRYNMFLVNADIHKTRNCPWRFQKTFFQGPFSAEVARLMGRR
jgi:hypothetical protein